MGIEPTHSQLRCDALPIELPSPWEQGGGEKGYTSASSWCPFPKINFSYGTPLGGDAATYGIFSEKKSQDLYTSATVNDPLMSWA